MQLSSQRAALKNRLSQIGGELNDAMIRLNQAGERAGLPLGHVSLMSANSPNAAEPPRVAVVRC
jgi:hypothetical protein